MFVFLQVKRLKVVYEVQDSLEDSVFANRVRYFVTVLQRIVARKNVRRVMFFYACTSSGRHNDAWNLAVPSHLADGLKMCWLLYPQLCILTKQFASSSAENSNEGFCWITFHTIWILFFAADSVCVERNLSVRIAVEQIEKGEQQDEKEARRKAQKRLSLRYKRRSFTVR